MIARVRPSLLLLDFDGVLVKYTRAARLAALARLSGCTPETVAAVLFDSGLERMYDSGAIDTAGYLQRLADGLGCAVDEDAWIASRVACSQADAAVLELVMLAAARAPVGVLTNNGPLMVRAMPHIVAPLFPVIEGRVLCSGALGARKPDRAIFERALAHFRARAQDTLFVDDLFVNVQGARRAGLHAETANDVRSMRKVLRRYALLPGRDAPA